jgi:hypothetical protein
MKKLFAKSLLRSIVYMALLTVAGAHADTGALDEKLTVGVVQRTIKIGMSSAAVVEALGSPNIVSTDSERREVWIYDKVSRTSVAQASKVGGSLILIGGSKSSKITESSQKSLTIIIKFDGNSLVRDFSYRQSSF